MGLNARAGSSPALGTTACFFCLLKQKLHLYLVYIKIKGKRMEAIKANSINSVCLILMGVWGYLEVSSVTALIPVFFGVILLLCSAIMTKRPNLNKLIAHIAVLLTLLLLFALIGMRLPKSLATGGVGLFRVLSMIATSIFAMVYFVKNFIDNRKNKQKN